MESLTSFVDRRRGGSGTTLDLTTNPPVKFWRKLGIHLLQIVALSSFAFAQPIFDLLSKNAEFLVVRRSQPLDIALLILVLCVAVPAALTVLETLVALVSEKALLWVHGFLLAVLAAVILLPVLKRIGSLPGMAWLALAFLFGLGFSFVYWRSARMKSLLLWLSWAVLLFPGLFLFNSPVYKLVFPKQDSANMPLSRASAPVVMVIFDEFPLISLLDEKAEIDAILYPNFAALTRSATWYRNTTTVSEGTLNAVPAILDGQYPRLVLQRLPNAADHPHSLFRLLGKTYRFNVVENNTRVCPDDLCGDSERAVPFRERMRGLLSDLSVLYLYIILPSDLAQGLPDVTHSWMGFAARLQRAPSPWLVYDKLTNWNNRIEIFRDFIRSIQPSPQPSLNFLHILLPHATWEFLPSGKKYSLSGNEIRGVAGPNDRGADPKKWTSDVWTVTQGYQRHLLQVGLMDRLVGELISHLKVIGLYDPALIVITADHGASFRPNDSRRAVTPTNYPDIMLVPLFIKPPHQQEGVTSDRNVQTMDILPTMADLLKIELPWEVDGCSAINPSISEKKEKIVISDLGPMLVFESMQAARDESLARKLNLFGSGRKPDGLFRIGRNNELIGRLVDSLPATSDSGIECDIDGSNYFGGVDLNAPFILTHITGHMLRPPPRNFRPLALAVAVNGFVRAVTETYQEGGEERFAALVPESALQPGHNNVQIYAVSGSGNNASLERMRKLSTAHYPWGSVVRFTKKENGSVYQAEGWGQPEESYTWNNGKQARIVLPVSTTKSGASLTMSLAGYLVPGKVDRQRVRVLINHKLAGEWLVTNPGLREQTLMIPREYFAGSPELVITLEMPEAVSPASVGTGADERQLAIALAWLRVAPSKDR